MILYIVGQTTGIQRVSQTIHEPTLFNMNGVGIIKKKHPWLELSTPPLLRILYSQQPHEMY